MGEVMLNTCVCPVFILENLTGGGGGGSAHTRNLGGGGGNVKTRVAVCKVGLCDFGGQNFLRGANTPPPPPRNLCYLSCFV